MAFMTSNWQWDLLIVLLAGGALLTAGYVYEKAAEWRDKKSHPAPGRIVAVGDHKLHLLYKASIGPTVVIEQGAGEPSRLWWPVQDKIAEFANVCIYDRAGYGWSEPVAAGRTIAERAEELHTLLTSAGIPGPYILVAHSYGGFIVRCFARNHPDQTAGLVLIDTPEETAFFRPEVLKFYSRLRFMNAAVELAARFGVLRLLSHFFPLDHLGFSFVRPAEYSAAGDDLASLQLVQSGGLLEAWAVWGICLWQWSPMASLFRDHFSFLRTAGVKVKPGWLRYQQIACLSGRTIATT